MDLLQGTREYFQQGMFFVFLICKLFQENKAMSSQLNDLRLQVERLGYDNKESAITIDILNERNQGTANELSRSNS